ncbi:MAG: YfhO family protein [Verrucomicrobiota bacterium]|nr:YfhO family protein [Verrucomicrobiota bacterium]
MANHKAPITTSKGHWWKALLLIALPLVLLFRHGFSPELVLFSNDGPLGVISAEAGALPSAFFGYWHDLNWVGMENPSALPDFSMLLGWMIANPVLFSKLYAPAALMFLGLSAWLMGRCLQWNPWICVLVGLAAALNSNAFSNACWGLPSRATTMASIFLAIAALHSKYPKLPLLRYILAGFAVGHGVLEGFDVGALYSIAFGLYVLFLPWNEPVKSGKAIARGIGLLFLIVLTAGWMASQGLITLVATQLSDAVEADATDPTAEQAKWNFSTQWSLPVNEAIRLCIPGFFGYRMSDLEGHITDSSYWGAVGRDPNWQPGQPSATLMRHSGSGEYAGITIFIIALWALIQTFRRENPIYDSRQKGLIRFWSILAVTGLLFAFGRHAPFYQIIYPLPFFNTMRNPIKCMHLTHLSLIILFGYGLQGLYQHYLHGNDQKPLSLGTHLRQWWLQVTGPDRLWTQAFVIFTGISSMAWLIYASSRTEMDRLLQAVGIPGVNTQAIHAFSSKETGFFLFWLILSGISLVLILSRYWTGNKRMHALLFIGALLVIDLSRANIPWIQYYDYKYKYATHPVLEVLGKTSNEGRVTATLNPFASSSLTGQQGRILNQIYNDWLQHAFPFHNIQSLDIIQWPRPPYLDLSFGSAFAPKGDHELDKYTRLWELTSTRYILGTSEFLDYLNQQFDPEKQRFRIHKQFAFVPKPGKKVDAGIGIDDLTTIIQTNAPFAVFEFTGAHPRAKLYQHWRHAGSDQEALETLVDPDFDPSQTAIVSSAMVQELPPSNAPNQITPAEAALTAYTPRQIDIQTSSTTTSLLVLHDRYHPDWRVYIDDRPATLMRCNHIMRGVFLPEGNHHVQFRFEPPSSGLYAGVLAWFTGFGILGIAWLDRRTSKSTQ